MDDKVVSRRSFLRAATASAAAFGVGSAFASCSSSSSGHAKGDVNSGPVSGDLTLWIFSYAPHIARYKALIKGFTAANPKVTIKLQSFSNIQGKLQSAFVSNTAPDLMAMHTGFSRLFVESGVLARLEDYGISRASQEKKYYPAVLDGYSLDGKTYGVPFGNNTPGIGMVVDLDVAKSVHWDVPAQFSSWDEVWQVAGRMTRHDASGRVTRAGLNVREGHQIQYVAGMMNEQGSTMFDARAGNFDALSGSAGINAMQLLSEATLKYKVDSPTLKDANTGLADGSSAMGMTYVDYLPYAKSQFPNKHFGFVMRPPYQGDKLMVATEGAWGAAANATSKNATAAAKFLQYCSSEDNLRTWYQSQTCPPPGPGFENDAWLKGDGAFLRPIIATLANWKFLGNYPIWDSNDIFMTQYQKMIAGHLSPEAACSAAIKGLNDLYGRYKKQVNGMK